MTATASRYGGQWSGCCGRVKPGLLGWVSNYTVDDLKEILQNSDVVVEPAVNQVEFHPFLYQKELLEFCGKNTIQEEAYSPLTRGKRLNHTTIVAVAKKYGKTPAQVLIRWSLQHGLVVIPFQNPYMRTGYGRTARYLTSSLRLKI